MRQQLIDHVRTNGSPLASVERRALIHMAQRLPAWVTPDHLSGLGLAAMAGAGFSFWLAQHRLVALAGVVLSLALNWFGDSLDGTLARVRNQQRPRFGFYVDHVIDIAGASMLFGGLAASGFMSPVVALGVLSAYLLVSAEVYLATHVRGVFTMSFLGFGPTELRIVLAIGVAMLAWKPMIAPFGFGPFRLFDVGGVVAILGMVIAFIASAVRNTRALFDAERITRLAAVAFVLIGGGAGAGAAHAASPAPQTLQAFRQYVDATHARIQAERQRALRALPGPAAATAVWEMASPSPGVSIDVPGALVHHWRGRIFVPHVDLATVLARVRRAETLLRQPDVRTARITARGPDHDLVMMAITRSQFVTAHYDTEHDVHYTRLDAARVAADSIATRIREVGAPGEPGPHEDRGFLWALRAWWRYEAVPGGVIIECESVSLSRAVPMVVRPVVSPIVTRFARESMERTLNSLREALTA
jgi:archaetidylinositol phosphate synthase